MQSNYRKIIFFQVHKAALEIEKSGRQIRSVLEKITSRHVQEDPKEFEHIVETQKDEMVEKNEEEAANEKENREEEAEVEEPPKKKEREILPGVENKKHNTSQKLCV